MRSTDCMLIYNQGTIEFLSTSFLRGITIDNGIIIVDECQNLNFHELDTIITRCGQNRELYSVVISNRQI